MTNSYFDGASPDRHLYDQAEPDIHSHVPMKIDLNVSESGYNLVPVGTSIPELQRSINAWAVRKEWRGPQSTYRPATVDCALFGTEVAEAVEQLRINEDPRHKWYSYTVELNGVKFENLTKYQLGAIFETKDEEELDDQITELGLIPKPEGFGPELADIVIRVLETAQENGIELLDELLEKMEYNESREIRHGGKSI